jgi:DNA-binding CsgD family transcriptional regulator
VDQAGERGILASAGEIVAALDDVPSPASLLDEHGVICWQNKASLQLRGSRIGSHFSQFAFAADAQEATVAFQQALAGGVVVDTDTRTLDAGGRYVWLRGRWNGIELRDGTKVVVVLKLGESHEPEQPAPASGSAEMVTRRQLEVLRLLDRGCSTAEMAVALTLSATTVRNHVAGLLTALGVHSRLQAVAVARAAGILDG